MNAGMLLMKCSQWTIDFLTNIYATRKFDAARALDQSGFQEFLDNLTVTEKRDHVKVVPKYAINVYTEEYRPGDFLLHMAGKLYEATEPGLFAIANQFDILSMVDDIEDVKAFFRGRHLLNYYSGTCKVKRGQRQSSCKPGDPRRILLNESLLSMSYPNRYRHVGLRYYWLGNWKDKYDDPSWNRKRRTLPTPLRLDPNLPPVPRPALHHVEEHLDDAALSAGQEGKVHEPPGKHEALHKEEHSKDEVPEVDHDADVKLAKELKKRGGAVAHDRDDDDDDDDDGGWPFYVWVILLSLIGATAAALGIVYKRRRKMSTKIQ